LFETGYLATPKFDGKGPHFPTQLASFSGAMFPCGLDGTIPLVDFSVVAAPFNKHDMVLIYQSSQHFSRTMLVGELLRLVEYDHYE